MNYLLYGTEKFLIDKEIKNIISKHKIDDIDISRYDLEVNSIKEIIDEANTISLFSNNRLIIVDNAFIFSRTTKKIDNIELLEEYLKIENKETIIIFVNLNISTSIISVVASNTSCLVINLSSILYIFNLSIS